MCSLKDDEILSNQEDQYYSPLKGESILTDYDDKATLTLKFLLDSTATLQNRQNLDDEEELLLGAAVVEEDADGESSFTKRPLHHQHESLPWSTILPSNLLMPSLSVNTAATVPIVDKKHKKDKDRKMTLRLKRRRAAEHFVNNLLLQEPLIPRKEKSVLSSDDNSRPKTPSRKLHWGKENSLNHYYFDPDESTSV